MKNIIVFCCLIAMIWWFYVQNQTSSIEQPEAKPQEYMSLLTITSYNEKGQPNERMQADYWEFIPLRGRSDLTNPHVTVYKANGDIWYLSALKAMAWHTTLADKISQIDLLGDVKIERPENNGATPTKVLTKEMQYFPNKGQVVSKEYVSMYQPGLVISGYGMLGYLNENRIELHDDITTIYRQTAG